jgi:ATP:ADP antiporter, AAA family
VCVTHALWSRRSLDLRPGEAAAVAWAALMFFAVLACYSLLRPARDALVLDGDPAFIPWLFTATFLAMLAIAPPWGAMVARWPRAALVPRVYRAFALQLLIFAAVLSWGRAPLLVGKIFYVWVSIFNLFVVSVFWSLCADLARPEQGKRIFGLIAAGGTAGALAGPALTRILAEHLSTAALLVIATALLELAVWCARQLDAAGRRLQLLRSQAVAEAAGHAALETARGAALETARDAASPQAPAAAVTDAARDDRGAAQAIGGSALAGLTRIVRSPYLAGIAFYILCTACLATFVYLRQAGIVKHALPDRGARTAFFAEVELWTSLAALALQVLVTGRALRWLGVGAVLAVLPIVQGCGMLLLVSTPTLAVATAVSSIGRACTHALARPSRELLFTAASREDRFKAKNVIDTFVYRFGDFASAWVTHALAVAAIAAGFVVVPLALLWTATAAALGLAYRRRTTANSSAPRAHDHHATL